MARKSSTRERNHPSAPPDCAQSSDANPVVFLVFRRRVGRRVHANGTNQWPAPERARARVRVSVPMPPCGPGEYSLQRKQICIGINRRYSWRTSKIRRLKCPGGTRSPVPATGTDSDPNSGAQTTTTRSPRSHHTPTVTPTPSPQGQRDGRLGTSQAQCRVSTPARALGADVAPLDSSRESSAFLLASFVEGQIPRS